MDINEKVSFSVEIPYKLYKSDGGGVKFKLHPRVNLREFQESPIIWLLSKSSPHEELYKILFDYEKATIYITTLQNVCTSLPLPEALLNINATIDLWLSWYSQEICMGVANEKPFFIYPRNITGGKAADSFIGFIKFSSAYRYDFIYEGTPRIMNPLKDKELKEGQLHWVGIEDGKLPLDAFIGGFETEPLYVARALYRGSLCPGKYVPSRARAYVAWGGIAHEKQNFQILCGYNAKWVKCSENKIPENVFIAGTSEVRNEPLYIGRAFLDGNLIVGKVHMLYKTCYLPFQGVEREVHEYEILVDLTKTPRGVPCK